MQPLCQKEKKIESPLFRESQLQNLAIACLPFVQVASTYPKLVFVTKEQVRIFFFLHELCY